MPFGSTNTNGWTGVTIIKSLFFCLCLVGGCGLVAELFSPKIDSTTTTTTENRSESTAGRDSTIWNVTFSDVLGKSGYAIPLLVVGWIITKRRTTRALDTVIESIQTSDGGHRCDACKDCVEARNNRLVNKRVAVVTTRMKDSSP